MNQTAKLTDPPETCRPSIGVGVPGKDGGARDGGAASPTLVMGKRFDLRNEIGNELVHRLAKSTAIRLIEDTTRSLMAIMGLSSKDAGFCLRATAHAIDPQDDDTPAPVG